MINLKFKKQAIVQTAFWYCLVVPLFMVGQKFRHQVYIMSDQFQKEKCEVYAPCDCCASDLIFLTRKKFALVDRCLYNDTYIRGTYAVNKNKLILKFKPMVVTQIYDEKTNQERVDKKEITMDPLTLEVGRCEPDKILLKHPTIKEYKYGSRREGHKEKEIISALKNAKAWKSI